MNETAWAELAEAKSNPMPTPPIGTTVQWLFEGDQNNIRPAIVTGIEDPGRLKLVTFPQGQMPQYKQAVYYVSHKNHKVNNHPTTRSNGAWRYLPGEQIPKAHYAFHEEEIKKREDNLRIGEELAAAQKAAHDAKKAEIEAMKAAAMAIQGSTKKKPAPIPA